MSWASTTLDLVETAITNFLTGGANQSYSISGRSFTKANLSELMEFRMQLQKEVADAASQAGSIYLAELNGQPSHRRFEI